MRTRATRGLLAAVLLASTTATIGVSTAGPAAAACSTWQYQIKSQTGAYDQSGSWQATAYTGYKLNTDDPRDYEFQGGGLPDSGLLKKGRVWIAPGQPLLPGNTPTTSYVRKVMLDYVTCW